MLNFVAIDMIVSQYEIFKIRKNCLLGATNNIQVCTVQYSTRFKHASMALYGALQSPDTAYILEIYITKGQS
jgi:hypothetical protein